MSESLEEVERRYEATILRLEGKLADVWDEGQVAGRRNYSGAAYRGGLHQIANPYRNGPEA